MYTFYLGVATLIGEHEIAQTYIQLIGLILSFLSAVAVIITLNLQRISNNQQQKINELETKIKLRELTPNLELRLETIDRARHQYSITMGITENQAIIYMMGFKENRAYIVDDSDRFSSYGQVINIGTYNLKRFRIDYDQFSTDGISEEESHHYDLILEIIFTDSNMIQKYKTEYILSELHREPILEHSSIATIR